jgi:hypothetical protein
MMTMTMKLMHSTCYSWVLQAVGQMQCQSLSPVKYRCYYFATRQQCNVVCVRPRLKCDGTRAETGFRLSAWRTSPFKSAGASVQPTTGSRGVRIGGNNAGYTMFRGSVKSTGYPLHSPVSPSLPLPFVTVCHRISTGLYLWVQTVGRTECYRTEAPDHEKYSPIITMQVQLPWRPLCDYPEVRSCVPADVVCQNWR